MKYEIADIIVDLDIKYPKLTTQSEAYKYIGDKKANATIRLPEGFMEDYNAAYPYFDLETIEYMLLGAQYYTALIYFDGMMLHSSCVVYDNKAYLFSAPSGTGKSTHTQLWLKRFPGAYILNDDKPAIRITPNGIFAYGTPFSGKTDLNVNTAVKIGGICFVERSETNRIEKMPTDEALFNLLNQTVRPHKEDEMDKLLQTLEKVVEEVPTYRLFCNMELEAAEVSYNGMNN